MIIRIENFAPDASAIRESVVKGGFASYVGPDGATYTGISRYPVPQWFEQIGKHLGRAIIPKLSCFRLNLDGELPHSWVHSDDICAKYASVLYLNTQEQCKGGTAFWKHKTLNIDRLPAPEQLGEGADTFYMQMNADWKILDLWERIDMVAMKWNRFITYPTSLFHSRFPFEGFGSGPEDGRLIWICFYDLAEPA